MSPQICRLRCCALPRRLKFSAIFLHRLISYGIGQFVWRCCRKTRKIPNEIYILSETSKKHKKEIIVSEHEISTICKIINISKTMQDSPKTQMCHCANSYHRERSRLLVSSSHTIRLPQYGPNRPPKRHILAWFHVFWAIACKNSSTGLTCARAWEKKV